MEGIIKQNKFIYAQAAVPGGVSQTNFSPGMAKGAV
jgi:hypothetical protein